MAHFSPTPFSDVKTVGAASVQFDTTLAAGELYAFSSSTACWIAQGANPTAAAADGSTFVDAGVAVLLDGALGAKVAVIQNTTGGSASLTRLKKVG